jgi:hypothetical protein
VDYAENVALEPWQIMPESANKPRSHLLRLVFEPSHNDK